MKTEKEIRDMIEYMESFLNGEMNELIGTMTIGTNKRGTIYSKIKALKWVLGEN